MAYRKERALLLMAANGAGLAILGPKCIDARIAENWELLNLYCVLAIIFVPGMLAGYIALALAGEPDPVTPRKFDAYRAWEALAVFPLLTIAFYIQVGTEYREAPHAKPAESSAPLAPPAADPSPPTPARPPG